MLTYASLLKPIRSTSPPPVLSDQRESNFLCDYCENIASSFREISRYMKRGERIKDIEYVRFDFYPDFPNLRTSAQRGCTCCALLRYTIRKNWSQRPFTEHRVGDIIDSMPVYTNFLAAEWDGQICIDTLYWATSSAVAQQVEFLTVNLGPSAYRQIKNVRVVEHDDPIDTLDRISVEFMMKVYKPACSSTFSLKLWERNGLTDLVGQTNQDRIW